MGKYDAILNTLKPVPPQDQPYQQRVDAVKETLAPLDTRDVAAEYVGLRKGRGRPVDLLFAKGLNVTREEEQRILVDALGKDGIEALLKVCNLRIEAATQLLIARQEAGVGGWGEYGVKDNALRMEDGGTIRVKSEPYPQVKDKEAYRLWCIANGYETQMQLWPTTTAAIAKERRLNGDPDPDGVEVFRKESLVYVGPGSAE